MHRDPVSCLTAETGRKHFSWGSIGIKHVLHNPFPMFLPIWEAEPEGTLGEADHLNEKRKDAGTVSSLCQEKGVLLFQENVFVVR